MARLFVLNTPLLFVIRCNTIFSMTDYIKPSSYRLPDDALAIIARIRATGTPGRAVNSTNAIEIALHFWDEHHPDVTAESSLADLREKQSKSDQPIWDHKDV